MKKFLFNFMILVSAVNASEKSAGPTDNSVKITIGTKQPTAIYSIPYDNNAADTSCTFDNIVNKLNPIKNSKRQHFYLNELVSRECTEQIGGLYRFGETVSAPKGPGVIIVNKHGAIACKTDMNFAVRTYGKSIKRKILTAGISSGGSKIWCDYISKGATEADIKKLDKTERNKLRRIQYSNKVYGH